MKQTIDGGVWPTMVTPFDERNGIDYESVERQVEWYAARGVRGLFAVCQSSEMFFLSLAERTALASFVKRASAGRFPVIASGHVSDAPGDQVEELQAMAETGVDAVVLITNRLARQDESDEVWLERLEWLLERIPASATLGLYECPYPYKRVLSAETLGRCAEYGRFRFLKDTSCDIDNIRAKLETVRGTELRLFNANSATLLESLRLGAVGYSGVMANFHPELYATLTARWWEFGEEAEKLSDFLSLSALIERQSYPTNAKYYLMLEGVFRQEGSRTQPGRTLTATERLEVEQLRRLTAQYIERYGG
ncbi:dihydrodipicolinate synthase family protein [Paenibacillus antri]|uniref:Dihydrodipicolinate synthase family protein n=1 Tax=Paenibacillus antri TaxID=2582848 RepID=A0A5R9GKX1_9BACL|nr:dihydrodipicolinate synthase family protein [Paenibacillus antri]TLS54294.1 dihydrodipicolinate synthase family protein [Paenibacillus antri]